MALIAQFDKFAVVATRHTSFVPSDSKDGKPMVYDYLTGIDCVSGACFSDVAISDDSPVRFEQVQDNTVYDCVFNFSVIKGEKNAQRLQSVKLVQRCGQLEIKLDKKA